MIKAKQTGVGCGVLKSDDQCQASTQEAVFLLKANQLNKFDHEVEDGGILAIEFCQPDNLEDVKMIEMNQLNQSIPSEDNGVIEARVLNQSSLVGVDQVIKKDKFSKTGSRDDGGQ